MIGWYGDGRGGTSENVVRNQIAGCSRSALRDFLLWLLTPPCGTGIRDLIGVIFVLQGLVRLIDGRVFSTTALVGGSTEMYGLAQMLLGMGLLLTRKQRHARWGRGAAAFACGMCVWLVIAAWDSSATSAVSAIVMSWGLFLESRAWILRGEC